MSDVNQKPASPEEDDEQAYLQYFAEQNGVDVTPSAEEEDDEPSVGSDSDDSPDDKDPAPDAHKAPGKGKASDVTSPSGDDPYAWINALPEDVREQAKALRHKFVSTTGRISAYQSRLDAAESELAALRAARQSRPQAAESPKNTKEETLSPELEEFIEKYPKMAASVKAMIEQERRATIEEVNKKLTPIEEERIADQVRKARQKLDEGASKLFNTPETGIHYKDVLKSPLYKEVFLPAQPTEFQHIARTTTDPDTALWVMKQFVEFAEDYADEEGLVEQVVPPKPRSGSGADKALARRQARQESAGTPPPRSVVSDPTVDGSYEDYFYRLNAKKK